MAVSANGQKSNGRRRSILDLAPLERDCMLALWPLGQGTVRQIRDELAGVRPRAYTTIMTIMDRLAKKGVVNRSKVGRGYVYRPNFTAQDVQAHAVAQLVDHFFEGSAEALLVYLSGGAPPPRPERVLPAPPRDAPRREETEERPAESRLDETLL